MTTVETGTQSSGTAAQPAQSVVGQHGRGFRIEVNGRELQLVDPIPQGRQILSAAGFNPADEHVLVVLLRHGTQSLGLDEEVDLRTAGREAFRAFKSDRLFHFTLDGRGYEWGASSITETELRRIADVPGDMVLMLERQDEEDHVLTDGERLKLADAGTEHLRTATKLVRVFIDDVEKHIPRGTYTTEQLLDVLKVAPGYLLNVLDEKGQLQPLQPGQTVRVKDGLKFYSQAPGGGAA